MIEPQSWSQRALPTITRILTADVPLFFCVFCSWFFDTIILPSFFQLGVLILISAPQRYLYILEGHATKELLRWRIDPVAHLSSLWDWGYLTLVVLRPINPYPMGRGLFMVDSRQVKQSFPPNKWRFIIDRPGWPLFLLFNRKFQDHRITAQPRSFFKSILCEAAGVCGISGIMLRGFTWILETLD